MPLTPFQKRIAQQLAQNRTEESHLAGGAALHLQANSVRYSEDLDYFHDSDDKVSQAFKADKKLLEDSGYQCSIQISQPGYIRCLVKKDQKSTKIEWAHDSAWRFMPAQYHKELGYTLHPIDLAINKVLALAGRDEPRDYVDVIYAHETILPLGPLCWAACGKDPGLTPDLLLELLKRKGKYRPEDLERLHTQKKLDVHKLKLKWLNALKEAEKFISMAPPDELGCLYYSKTRDRFVAPDFNQAHPDIVPHHGQSGGVLPIVKD